MHPKVGKFGAFIWLFESTDKDDSTGASRRVNREVEGTSVSRQQMCQNGHNAVRIAHGY
jgi:hypothetical protein